jgi:DNA-binding transcriptional ArsR family regulator
MGASMPRSEQTDGRGAPDRAREYVPVDEVEAAKVQVAISPLPTVFMFALGSITTRNEVSGVGPSNLTTAVRSRLRARDIETLLPIADPRTTGWPDVLTIGAGQPGVASLDDELDAILSTDPDQFVASLENGWGQAAPSWLSAKRNPERWIHRYVDTMRRAWQVTEPLWTAARGRLDREVERVGAAVALGAVAECIVTLDRRGAIEGDEWRFSDRAVDGPSRWHLSDAFVVSPLVVEEGVVFHVDDDDESALTHMSYPLPGAWRAFDHDAALPESLDGLLGAQRARILLRLDQPATAGEIAEAMYATPAAATYQLRMLERAGLVSRHRNGRAIRVERTPRGTALIELFAGEGH